MRKLLPLLLLALLATPAEAARIECITANTIDGSTSLSATAIRVKGGNLAGADIEVYSDADAEDGPTTCTVGGSITCAGWDTSGAAEIWKRCDRNAPWLQMGNTATMTAATRYSVVLESDCLVALKVTDTGAGGDVCLYLSVTSEKGLSPTNEVQDGSTKGSWAELVP